MSHPLLFLSTRGSLSYRLGPLVFLPADFATRDAASVRLKYLPQYIPSNSCSFHFLFHYPIFISMITITISIRIKEPLSGMLKTMHFLMTLSMQRGSVGCLRYICTTKQAEAWQILSTLNVGGFLKKRLPFCRSPEYRI